MNLKRSINLENLIDYNERVKTYVLDKLNNFFSNKDVLDKFSEDSNGNLLFDGSSIETSIDTSVFMKKDEYVSSINDGSIKKADVALELDGVKQAQPLMYYGTDNNGNVGFHYIPIDKNTKDGEIEQRVILNAKTNETYTVDSAADLSDGKAIVQAYKFVQGEQNVIKTIKEFNNSNSENFHYDKTNISFNDGCSIKNKFEVEVNKNSDLYESEMINKNDFVKMTIKGRG